MTPSGADDFWTRRRLALAWVGIIVTWALLRITIISIPFERDEGCYAYIAQRALLGDVPYRDYFDHKPPGIYLLYAIALSLFGQSVESVHIFTHLWVLASAYLLYRLVSRLSSTGAGLFAAFVLVITTSEKGVLGSSANTEPFMILPMIASLLCLFPKSGHPGMGRLIGAGALCAAAFWIKQVAFMDSLLVGAWVIYLHARHWPRIDYANLARDVLYLIIGAVAMTAPILLYFVLNHAWTEFIFCAFTYNFGYATTDINSPKLMWERFSQNFGTILAADWLIWAAMIIGIVMMFLAKPRSWPMIGFYLAFFVLSFIPVCFGGYFRPHYFTQLAPVVAALAGIGLTHVMRWISRIKESELRLFGYSIVPLAIIAAVVIANADILFAATPNLASVRLYRPTAFIMARQLGEQLQAMTQPDDTILVAGTEPEILFWSHRKSATRYIFFDPLVAKFPTVLDEQKKTLDEIVRNRPRFIVDLLGPRGQTMVKPGISETYLFEEFDKFRIQAGYKGIQAWRATTEDMIHYVPNLYAVMTNEQYNEITRQRGPVGATLFLYVRPDLPPATEP